MSTATAGPVREVDVPADELAFHRRSGRVSLDLVATIGERWRARFERLREPGDVDRWLELVGVPVGEPASGDDLRRWRRLRGAIETLAVAAMTDRDYPREAVRIVNEAAAHPDPPPRLTTDGAVEPAGGPQAAARAACARDAVRLFGGQQADRVRECAADDCALVFVDTSRPGNRRWCSMAACGNRHKVARHRRRQQD